MTDTVVTTSPQTNPFDARGPFLLSLFMTLVGYSVLVALPAINGAWVDQLGFSDVEVNRVASADLLGLFIGAVLTSLLIKRWNRQRLTYLGITLAVIANGLCTRYVDYETTLALRFIAGLGSGSIPPSPLRGSALTQSHAKPFTGCCWPSLSHSSLNSSLFRISP